MKFKDWVYFIVLALIWGSSFLWIKIVLRETGPFTLVAFRVLFGVVGLGVVLLILRPIWPQSRKLWLFLLLLGVTNSALPFVLISWGEQHIDSAVAAILNSSVPLFTTLIAHLALRDDRITPARILGVITGFAGIVILFSRDLGGGIHASLLGQAAVLLAAISYASSSVAARKYAKDVSPMVQAFLPMVTATTLLWIAAPLLEAPFTLPKLPLSWLALAWLGLLGSCVAFILFYSLLHSVGPTRTTMVTYTFPLTGIILGVIFLGEQLDGRLILGAAMIILSIWVVNSNPQWLQRQPVVPAAD